MWLHTFFKPEKNPGSDHLVGVSMIDFDIDIVMNGDLHPDKIVNCRISGVFFFS